MFNAKRLFGYLATGVMPERTALDAAIALAEAMDAIDFAAHDKRYHGGKYDPDTMTCGMRQALEKGDLSDVLAAEEEEGRARQKLVRRHPERVTDEEFADYYGKPTQDGQERIKKYVKKNFEPAKQDGGGTLLGSVSGMDVFPHSRIDFEMSRSRNAYWLMKNDPDTYREKALLIRHVRDILKTVEIDSVQDKSHKSTNHVKWQCEKGFATASFTHKGKPWYFVFGMTGDNRLLLYDIVQKEKGQLRT